MQLVTLNPKKIGAIIAVCSMALAAQAQLVDSLTSGSVSAYTNTIILAQNGDGPMTLSSSGSGLQVNRTFSSGGNAQQDLFLRGDYSLSVGNTLRVTVSGLSTSAFNADFGIAIASQVNPVSATPWVSGTLSTRSNYLAMYVKPASSEVGAAGFNGTAQLISTHNTPTGGAFLNIDGLWISETAANVFSVGYTIGVVDTTYASGITFTGASVDNSIGFFSDLRATGTSPVFFTNLTISPIPEPSTLAMCGLGFGGLLVAIRRKK